MKSLTFLPLLFVMTGCGATATTFVKAQDTTLGRVVVYRNGVAYFERTAEVEGDHLNLSVPSDKVDDFLKSLTVVDAQTGQPAPISYPTKQVSGQTGLINMKIGLSGPHTHRLKLSYVTDAPSWKPSYRVVLGKNGKVDLQAWAIVDNTSGEDWNNVRLGVGSSSALSFRFDLQSVRLVERETLQQNDLFAYAPPTGGATYGGDGAQRKLVADMDDSALAAANVPAPATAPPVGGAAVMKRPAMHQPPGEEAHDGIARVARSLQNTPNQIVVEGYATADDGDKQAASLDRANKMREQLVRNGVDPSKVVAVGRGEQSGHVGGIRIVEAQADAKAAADASTDGHATAQEPANAQTAEPIGTSNFESGNVTSVARGTSAMVSIMHSETDGEVVYLYDPESARGNAQFPFRSVRLKNPSQSALETGPVTVFGGGRFIGEGMAEPIPAASTAFVPFALDRQVVVDRQSGEVDVISRILTVQRGVFSTEVQHKRHTTFTLNNRLDERATVYVRHTVAPGYKLSKVPAASGEEKIGNANLFRVSVEPHGKAEVTIEESTPVYKTIDVRTADGIEQVRVYLSRAVAEGPLKHQVEDLLKLNKDMSDISQHVLTTREQMAEYRVRMDELHAQLVTLKLVKTAGPLMQSLEKKMQDVSDRLSKATIDVVGLQENLMVARIHFQDGVADLTLLKIDEKAEKTATK
jgi:hypothetical protein